MIEEILGAASGIISLGPSDATKHISAQESKYGLENLTRAHQEA
jgi:hypothetical protein